MSLALSGQIGKAVTFERRRSGHVAVEYHQPTGTPTAGQTSIRDLFRYINLLHRSLTFEQKASYLQQASIQNTTTIAIFTKLNVPALRSQTSLLNLHFTALPLNAPGPASFTATPGVGQIFCSVGYPQIPPGWVAANVRAWAIPDADPYTATQVRFRGGSNAYPATNFSITGLTAGVLYIVGAAIQWTHPTRGKITSGYINRSATPT